MDLVLLVALTPLILMAGLLLSAFREGPSTMPNMWRYRTPDWPHGVQEDDDARFVWERPRPDPMQPVLEDVHGRVRPAR